MLSEEQGMQYGIGTQDTPIFEHMHEASAQLVGGTLTAVDAVMEGDYTHAVNIGGGLHHGFKGKHLAFVYIMMRRLPSNIYENIIT